MSGATHRLTAFGLDLPQSLRLSAVERTFAQHANLFLQGEQAAQIYGILSGRVTLWRAAEDGSACTLLLLGKGEMLGSVAVAQGGPHLTAATALDNVVAVTWSAEQFRMAMRDHAALAQSFLQSVARRAAQLIDRFDDIAGLDVEVRLARLLLRLSAQFGEHDDALAVVIDIRQKELAELAFTTVPTVSRTLSRWKAGGVVSLRRGGIVVPHLSRLATLGGIHLD